MKTIIDSILLGVSTFPFFAIICTLPIFAIVLIRYKALNFVRIGLNYSLLLYFLCLIALVFFPLPSAEKAACLSTHDIQLIPFKFVSDIVRESPFDFRNPATYISALLNYAVLQVLFNILMLIPLGMFLRYYFHFSTKKIVMLSFLLSFFIELTQLTGIYGIYHGSYRLCDVDDLITNTLGGYLGCQLISSLERFIPSIEKFDIQLPVFKHNYSKAR
jgi:glycopeptide antibiotics resistance protein